MTLSEFTALARNKIDSFHTDWLDEHAGNAEEWPVEMTEAEWIEQLLCWMESR